MKKEYGFIRVEKQTKKKMEELMSKGSFSKNLRDWIQIIEDRKREVKKKK